MRFFYSLKERHLNIYQPQQKTLFVHPYPNCVVVQFLAILFHLFSWNYGCPSNEKIFLLIQWYFKEYHLHHYLLKLSFLSLPSWCLLFCNFHFAKRLNTHPLYHLAKSPSLDHHVAKLSTPYHQFQVANAIYANSPSWIHLLDYMNVFQIVQKCLFYMLPNA